MQFHRTTNSKATESWLSHFKFQHGTEKKKKKKKKVMVKPWMCKRKESKNFDRSSSISLRRIDSLWARSTMLVKVIYSITLSPVKP